MTMSENDPQPVSDDEALRKRLLNRIAVAGVIIVGLLAGLAAFDALVNPGPPQKQAKPEEPAPPPIKPLAEAKPELPAPPAELPAEKPVETPHEPPAVPEQSAAPEPPPLPEPKQERPLTKPATARPAMHKPTQTPVAAESDETPTAAPQAKEAPAHAAPGPIARAVAAARHYILQLGVFSNPVNAEELRAKLSQNGIPAQIESRVQVGPFATRKEAEETRQKLIALGIEPGIVVTVKK
jgi:DedD protein